MDDYDKVIQFLIELSEENRYHINWNWARFEWMIGHPYTNIEEINKIGLWYMDDRIVGAAIYDMSRNGR